MNDDSGQHSAQAEAGDRPRFREVVMDDLKHGDFQRTFVRDLEDVYEFYLDDASRNELGSMGSVSRWTHLVYWVMRNSILRLSPARRLILLGSTLLFLHAVFINFNVGTVTLAFLMLLLTLMLELKDKLLAQDELETGRAVQKALLPKTQPTIAGWDIWVYTRPANEVGGDLVDYVALDDGRLGVAVGDVAGKGLGAALFMAKLQSVLRALVAGAESLDVLGRDLNNIFRRDGLPNRFISLAYLELHPGAGDVRLFNAGHLPPLVMRGRTVERLPKGGPALGLVADAQYRERKVSLKAGDWIVLYSDGVTEARNTAGLFFGEKTLGRLLPVVRKLSAEAAGKRLLDAIDRFVGDARPSDDISLALIKRLGDASPETGERNGTPEEEVDAGAA